MKKTSIDYIVKAVGGELYASAGEKYRYIDTVSIDSRHITGECLFFCIIGERNDAHKFLPDVKVAGCHSVVVSDADAAEEMKLTGDMNIIKVSDTTRALIDLATSYMDDWTDLIRVGITGSVGKTSTKEFTYSVLSSKYRTGKTKGNLNSQYGIPLTVFDFDPDIEVAVVEMGIGDDSYMSDLAGIVKPDIAIITIVGNSHKEIFGSREGLLEEKLAITSHMRNGVLIVNSDCDLLNEERIRKYVPADVEIRTVGTGEDADYIITDIEDDGVLGTSCRISSALSGESDVSLEPGIAGAHNLINACEAVAAGEALDVDIRDAAKAAEEIEMNENRMEIIENNGIKIINDTYNASPESMKAGLKVLAESEADRRIAILGSMFELGDDAAELHKSVGREVVEQGIDVLITIGMEGSYIAEGAAEEMIDRKTDGGEQAMSCSCGSDDDSLEIYTYMSKSEILPSIKDMFREGDVVLVKASRAMELEEISNALAGR